MFKAVNISNKTEIGNKIHSAFSFFMRLKGLLGRESLLEGEGLLIHPCSSIHCFGMRFAIDVLFLDGDYRIIELRENMKPGEWAACKGAHCVLELPAGSVQTKKIFKNDQLLFSKAQ